MASIQTREGPRGTRHRVVYRVDGRQQVDVFADYAEAQRHLALVERIGGKAARHVLYAREATPGDHIALAEWCRTYIDRLEDVTDGTRKDYRGMVANRLDGTVLGQLPLTAVDRDAVTHWLRDLDVATKTRRNYHALVSAALSAAVEAGHIPGNPARGIRLRRTEPAGGMVILSAGELALLVGELPAQYQPITVLLAGTGLRWGEATALQVGDVDLDARVPLLRVLRAWKRTGDGSRRLGPPKTEAGIRTVSLPPEVADTIRHLVEGRPASAWLFTNGRGEPLRLNNFHDLAWKPALDRLTADGRMTKRPRVHDLRHSHASTLVASGVPLNVVQKRLGHESIKTTVDRYSHLMPDHLEVAAAAASLGLVQAVPQIEA